MKVEKETGTDQPTGPIKDIPAPGTLAETNALLRAQSYTLARILGMHAALVNPNHQCRDLRAQASACTRQIIDFAGLGMDKLLPDGEYVVRGGVIQPCRPPSDNPVPSGSQEATNA